MPPTDTDDGELTPKKPAACAVQLAQKLQANSQRIVFAESCTCGLVAALMGQVPGVSSVLCGSAVTYRVPTKRSWLSVDSEILEKWTAESLETSLAMAQGVLKQTSEADIAVAITGHLGPDVDQEKDGIVFLAMTQREKTPPGASLKVKLGSSTRVNRQFEAAKALIQWTLQQL